MTKRTELNISNALPDRIALVFDGHLIRDAHFVGFFASFPSSSAHGSELACMALPTTEYETIKSAEEHKTFLLYVLRIFKTSFENVTVLIGDSFATDQIIATKLKKPLIRCVAPGFQLSVREVIADK